MNATIVADSSSIISLAINCLSSVLNELDAKILVTGEIYREIIERPAGSKRYALESMRIKRLFSEGVVSVREPSQELVERIMRAANSIYSIRGRNLELVHRGEMEALALVGEIGANALLMDERTTRMLIEDPQLLGRVLEEQSGRRVEVDRRALDVFRGSVPDVRIIRSSEVAAVAYEKGILGRNLGAGGREVLMATLYALKFSGCAISWREIEEYSSVFQ